MIAMMRSGRVSRTVLPVERVKLAFMTSSYAVLPFFRMSWSFGVVMFPLLMLQTAIRLR
jgi:hypothetical protein